MKQTSGPAEIVGPLFHCVRQSGICETERLGKGLKAPHPVAAVSGVTCGFFHNLRQLIGTLLSAFPQSLGLKSRSASNWGLVQRPKC